MLLKKRKTKQNGEQTSFILHSHTHTRRKQEREREYSNKFIRRVGSSIIISTTATVKI